MCSAMSQAVRSRTIRNAAAKEEITFVETAEDSGGDRVVLRLTLGAGGVVPSHAQSELEVFECLEGQLQFQLGRKVLHLTPGNTVTAPPGTLHGFRNVTDEPATLRIVATPGASAESGLRLKMAMFEDGFFAGNGRPKDLFMGALVLQGSRLYMPPLPTWLYWTLMSGLAAIGRLRGKEKTLAARYPEYTRLLEARRTPAVLAAEVVRPPER